MLNQNLGGSWDFIMRMAKLELDGLPRLPRHHVTNAEPVDEGNGEVELILCERVPLGLNILTNDDSGRLEVVDLPRGMQERKAA